MKRLKLLGVIVGIFAVVLIACFPMLAEDMDKSKIGINQIPVTGTYEYWTDGGFQWQKFGNVSIYDKTSQIWFNEIKKDPDGNPYIDSSLENPAMTITYNDKGKGFVMGSVRVEMPLESKYLETIQTHYGSQEKLIRDLVKQTLSKVVMSCGPLMSSLESVSEKRTDLISLITDQLNHGVYKTKVTTVKSINPLTGEEQLTKIAEVSKGYKNTTNNRMELKAIIIAFTCITAYIEDVTIISDSMYAIGTSRIGSIKYKRNTNLDVLQELDNIVKEKRSLIGNLHIEWVKGHYEDEFNARADKIAVDASQQLMT